MLPNTDSIEFKKDVARRRRDELLEAERVAKRQAKEDQMSKGRLERACFWTWPWGHVYVEKPTCEVCGHYCTTYDDGSDGSWDVY